ncbi:MAG: hypothetical protein O2997_05770 [Proteobacteria bacterium]|nr:hypothetical protein [Pseudomonadota bacterium]
MAALCGDDQAIGRGRDTRLIGPKLRSVVSLLCRQDPPLEINDSHGLRRRQPDHTVWPNPTTLAVRPLSLHPGDGLWIVEPEQAAQARVRHNPTGGCADLAAV